MKDILIVVLPIITSAVTGVVCWYIQKNVEFNKVERQALQLLMRDLFLNKYQDVETKEDYDYIEKVYTTYTKLGGNGYVTKKFEELQRRV